jgi:type II secretory pathway pseudopilin PulG
MRGKMGRVNEGGFTLVELIAVIAVVVLMAWLLIPAMAKGRREASASRCMNNVRALAFAAQLYAEDNNDLWPANGVSDASLNLANPPPNYVPRVWAEGREASNISPGDETTSERVSLIAKYVSDQEVFRCPGENEPNRARTRTIRRPRSYGMNLFVGWTPDRITGPVWYGEPNERSQTFRTRAATVQPAEIFLFGEIHPFSICYPAFGTHPRWDSRGNPTGQNLNFHVPGNNHGGVTVFSMADGHAEIHRWMNPRFNDPESGGRPLPESHSFWHTHELPLPGVTAAQVAADFKWLTARATVAK